MHLGRPIGGLCGTDSLPRGLRLRKGFLTFLKQDGGPKGGFTLRGSVNSLLSRI